MSIQTITGGGVLSRKNTQQLNDNFTALKDPDVWVRPQNGDNANNGLTRANAKASISGCASLIEPGIVIGVEGVLFEEYTGPIVNDVTIQGMMNLPRQATTSGVANGGGATWLSPSGGTGILLTVQGQGWEVNNIYLNNSAAQPCIRLLTTGDPPTDADGAHFQLLNCRLTGEDSGLQASGGPGYVVVDGCMFLHFDSAGDAAIETITGAGIGTNSGWIIQHNVFNANAIHIDIASFGAVIRHNHFTYVRNGVTTTTQIDLSGSNDVTVYDNYFDVPYNENGLSAMFVAGTRDRWIANAMGTAVLTPMTGRLWGIPTSGAA